MLECLSNMTSDDIANTPEEKRSLILATVISIGKTSSLSQ